MTKTRKEITAVCCLLILIPIGSMRAQSNQLVLIAAPRVFLLDAKQLLATKERLQNGDTALVPAWLKLEADARKALAMEPVSIVTKGPTPPSGDKHDYLSQAPYFWADPKSANGLPYIRRDGERNPEINKITDHRALDQVVNAVETLALAYYLKGDQIYATKATQLLRVFFLAPGTRMNPNLQYAQFIPGVNTGRGIGLIETRGLTQMVDAVGLLAGSKALSQADQNGLRDWFSHFLQWMLESKNGRDEAAAKNNHGTYYDLQVTSFALFLGRREMAIKVLQASREKRIATQIEPDGRQPLELARTKAWSYSVGNLDGLTLLATLGERLGVDLWHYQTSDGRSIRRAIAFLSPFALGERKWSYQQIGEWSPRIMFPVLRRAAVRYEDADFRALLRKIPKEDPAERRNLLEPYPTEKFAVTL